MNSGRFVTYFAAILFALAASKSAPAQTAHFSGVVTSLVTGYSPSGVAVDLYGNLYITDSSAGAVRKFVAVKGQVSASSTVITVTGFNKPAGIAVDRAGNVFFSDSGNNAVKEFVGASGQLSSSPITVGSGLSAPAGVAVDGYGNVFVADTGNNAVKEIVGVNGKVSSSSTVNIVGSGFSAPSGVALDAWGNVYVADTGNDAVKEIVAVTRVVSITSAVQTIGSGFIAPSSVTVDDGVDLFVTDVNGIKEVLSSNASLSATSQVIALSGGVSAASGTAINGKGNLFAGDMGNQAIDEIQLGFVEFGSVNVGGTGGTILLPFLFDSAGQLGSWMVLTGGTANFEFKEATSGTTCSKTTTYAAGDSCSIAVTYSPQHPGWHPGAVQLLDSSGNVLATGNLKGNGVGPVVTFATPAFSSFYYPSQQKPLANLALTNLMDMTMDPSGNIFMNTGGISSNSLLMEIMAVNGAVSASPTIKTLATPGYPGETFSSVAVDGSGNVFVGD